MGSMAEFTDHAHGDHADGRRADPAGATRAKVGGDPLA